MYFPHFIHLEQAVDILVEYLISAHGLLEGLLAYFMKDSLRSVFFSEISANLSECRCFLLEVFDLLGYLSAEITDLYGSSHHSLPQL